MKDTIELLKDRSTRAFTIDNAQQIQQLADRKNQERVREALRRLEEEARDSGSSRGQSEMY